jgi:riboflavin synthase
MFTGIIQAKGRIAEREERGGDLRLTVDVRDLANCVDVVRLAVGQSVAVNGACLTVIGGKAGHLDFDVSRETLGLTTLGSLSVGTAVNLEAALCAGDPLGGHLVSGHVDGIAELVGWEADARSWRAQVEVPDSLALFIAIKGSVALDGVSLTVNEVEGRRFGVNLIPHTMEATTLGQLAVGSRLNLEVDPLARYVQRALQR